MSRVLLAVAVLAAASGAVTPAAEPFLPAEVAAPAGRLDLDAADKAAAALGAPPPRAGAVLRHLRTFRREVADAASRASPRIPMSRLSDRPSPGSLEAADDHGITILDAGQRMGMGWQGLSAREVYNLGKILYGSLSPEGRAGLAAFCLAQGLPEEAQEAAKGIPAGSGDLLAPYDGYLKGYETPRGPAPLDPPKPPAAGDDPEAKADALWREIGEAQRKRDCRKVLQILRTLETEYRLTRLVRAREAEIAGLRFGCRQEIDRELGFQPVFNGRDLQNWQTFGGRWSVANHEIVAEPTLDYNAAWIAIPNLNYDYVYAAEVRCESEFDAGLGFGWNKNAPFVQYWVFNVVDHPPAKERYAAIDLYRNQGWTNSHKTIAEQANDRPGEWNELRLEVRQARVTATLNDQPVFESPFVVPPPKGWFGLTFRRNARRVWFRHVVVKPLEKDASLAPPAKKGPGTQPTARP